MPKTSLGLRPLSLTSLCEVATGHRNDMHITYLAAQSLFGYAKKLLKEQLVSEQLIRFTLKILYIFSKVRFSLFCFRILPPKIFNAVLKWQ